MKLFNCVQKKKSSGSFTNVINKMCLEIIYLIYLDKTDFGLNNLQWLLCYQTKLNLKKQVSGLWSIWFLFVSNARKTRIYYGIEVRNYLSFVCRVVQFSKKMFKKWWLINSQTIFFFVRPLLIVCGRVLH